jgi:hypothetical protein
MLADTPTVAALSGLWRRTLIAWPDGRRDTVTRVRWLQGPRLYADLRQPAGRPELRDVGGLRDLRMAQIAWLARQEGFAGTLDADGGVFEWSRVIDFQPRARHVDAARLRFHGSRLIEEGRDSAYTEHWQRRRPAEPGAAARLRDAETGCTAILVRVGAIFMIARDRAVALPPHGTLADLVAGARHLRDAQAMIDCEISLGRVVPAGWRIERSTLPYRERRRLVPRAVARADAIEFDDTQPDGEPRPRRWAIVEAEGSLNFLLRAGNDPSTPSVFLPQVL